MELILDFLFIEDNQKKNVQQYIKSGYLVSGIVMRFMCRTKKTEVWCFQNERERHAVTFSEVREQKQARLVWDACETVNI